MAKTSRGGKAFSKRAYAGLEELNSELAAIGGKQENIASTWKDISDYSALKQEEKLVGEEWNQYLKENNIEYNAKLGKYIGEAGDKYFTLSENRLKGLQAGGMDPLELVLDDRGKLRQEKYGISAYDVLGVAPGEKIKFEKIPFKTSSSVIADINLFDKFKNDIDDIKKVDPKKVEGEVMVSDLYSRWDKHIGDIIRAEGRKNINEAHEAFYAEKDSPQAIGTTVIDGKRRTIYDHDIDLDLPEIDIKDDRSWLEKNYPEMPKVNLIPKINPFNETIDVPERPVVEVESEDEFWNPNINLDPVDDPNAALLDSGETVSDILLASQRQERNKNQFLAKESYEQYAPENPLTGRTFKGAVSQAEKDFFKMKFGYSPDNLSPNDIRDKLDAMHIAESQEDRFRGDTELGEINGETAHINPYEKWLIEQYGPVAADYIFSRTQELGGPTINPNTGMPEYWQFMATIGKAIGKAVGWTKGAGVMKNLGSVASSAKNFGTNWGGAISSVLGSFGKAKANKRAYKQAKADIFATQQDAAKFTGETVDSYRDIVEDFDDLRSASMGQTSEGFEDIVEAEDSMRRKSRGLLTGTIDMKTDEYTDALVSGYEENQRRMENQLEGTTDQFLRGVQSSSDSYKDALDQLNKLKRKAYSKRKWYKNIF